MSVMKNNVVKLILMAIAFELIVCNVDTGEYSDSLPSFPSMNEDSMAQKPARKPPRFGKRGFILMQINGKHLKKDLDSDYEKRLPVEWIQKTRYDSPYRMVYTNK